MMLELLTHNREMTQNAVRIGALEKREGPHRTHHTPHLEDAFTPLRYVTIRTGKRFIGGRNNYACGHGKLDIEIRTSRAWTGTGKSTNRGKRYNATQNNCGLVHRASRCE
ncbi:uncharacterized protein LOC120894992 [Anopheles arabiensis]|uniref:uncharacterized protein LOC120894992 n=1 Tax=Anopheles arabiensis TaxID=7173 RepID=UPI001AAD16B5|nr:uncharacterized protein LOC120894992 [Anopheles arabiensis]